TPPATGMKVGCRGNVRLPGQGPWVSKVMPGDGRGQAPGCRRDNRTLAVLVAGPVHDVDSSTFCDTAAPALEREPLSNSDDPGMPAAASAPGLYPARPSSRRHDTETSVPSSRHPQRGSG